MKVNDLGAATSLQEIVAHGLHQMGLAKTDRAIDEQGL